jgi:hypothetical protein
MRPVERRAAPSRGSGCLRRGGADTRSGRRAGARPPRDRARLATASVQEQQRRADNSSPCNGRAAGRVAADHRCGTEGPITSVARRARLGASLTSRPLLWRPVRAGSGRAARITTPPPASAIESRLSRCRLHSVPVAASVCHSAPSRGHSEGTLDTTRVSANANVVIQYGAGRCSARAPAGRRQCAPRH